MFLYIYRRADFMYERTENIEAYHDVTASSLISIINQLGKDDTKIVKRICKFNIMQAYIMYKMDNAEANAELIKKANENKTEVKIVLAAEVKALMKEYENKEVDEFLADMFIYQSLAGIKAVQTTKSRARTYEKIRSELSPG